MEGYLGMVCWQALLRIFILSVPSLKPVGAASGSTAQTIIPGHLQPAFRLWGQETGPSCGSSSAWAGATVPSGDFSWEQRGRRVDKPRKLALEKI